MSAVLVLARATFIEAVRARVFLYLLAVAALMIAGSVPTAELGVGEELRLTTDVALAGVAYVCAFLSVFLGVSAVSGEVEKRTVYTVIAKAATRSQFVVGKFFGVWATVIVAALAAYAMALALVSGLGGRFASELLYALWMQIFEAGMLVAVAVFFSCISKPLLSSGLTVALYLTGVSLKSIHFWARKSDTPPLTQALVEVFYRVLPNFELFDVRTEIVHHVDPPLAALGFSALYGVAYTGILLGCACLIFHRRDLK
ncbi:MAG: ABC transporter permease [Deltaproteobacteria bacterium]|nr:ABC transporter permease [Deltaproteobacteria bacterium]